METYFSIFCTRLMQTGFLPSGNSIFLVSAISLLAETIIGTRKKKFSEKELILASGQLIFWLVDIIFFLPFSETLANNSCFPSSGSVFFNKIRHSDWRKRIFWLVETVFFCAGVFLEVETVN